MIVAQDHKVEKAVISLFSPAQPGRIMVIFDEQVGNNPVTPPLRCQKAFPQREKPHVAGRRSPARRRQPLIVESRRIDDIASSPPATCAGSFRSAGTFSSVSGEESRRPHPERLFMKRTLAHEVTWNFIPLRPRESSVTVLFAPPLVKATPDRREPPSCWLLIHVAAILGRAPDTVVDTFWQ